MGSLTTAEAAERLGISPERIRIIIANGDLAVERRGSINLVDAEAVDRYAHNRPGRRGRPITQQRAWVEVGSRHPLDTNDPDSQRRHLRPRARFERYRYLPDRYGELLSDHRLVVSSRQAAIEAGVEGFDQITNDHRSPTVAYIQARDLDDVVSGHRLRATNDRATLILAVVENEHWPFAPGQRHAGLGVAWLDLEDERDRAADLTAQFWNRHR